MALNTQANQFEKNAYRGWGPTPHPKCGWGLHHISQGPPGREGFPILLMPGAAMVIREITTWVMPMAAALWGQKKVSCRLWLHAESTGCIRGLGQGQSHGQSELVKGKGSTCQGLSDHTWPSPTQPHSYGFRTRNDMNRDMEGRLMRKEDGAREKVFSPGLLWVLRTGQGLRGNSLLPPPGQASAHPGMTDLIVVPVLHRDSLDEFPKHRQEVLDAGKGCVGSPPEMWHIRGLVPGHSSSRKPPPAARPLEQPFPLQRVVPQISRGEAQRASARSWLPRLDLEAAEQVYAPERVP